MPGQCWAQRCYMVATPTRPLVTHEQSTVVKALAIKTCGSEWPILALQNPLVPQFPHL